MFNLQIGLFKRELVLERHLIYTVTLNILIGQVAKFFRTEILIKHVNLDYYNKMVL